MRMKRNLICKTFVIGALLCSVSLAAQKVSDKLPWSVRMTESEMIRCPGILATGFPAETEMGLLSRLGTRSNARRI